MRTPILNGIEKTAIAAAPLILGAGNALALSPLVGRSLDENWSAGRSAALGAAGGLTAAGTLMYPLWKGLKPGAVVPKGLHQAIKSFKAMPKSVRIGGSIGTAGILAGLGLLGGLVSHGVGSIINPKKQNNTQLIGQIQPPQQGEYA